jgi:hypothetical protein
VWLLALAAVRVFHPHIDSLWALAGITLLASFLASFSIYVVTAVRARDALWFLAMLCLALLARWPAEVLAVITILWFAIGGSRRSRN